MNRSLARRSWIRHENIDDHQLTLSLLSEGMRSGVLSADHVQGIQMELMALLSQAILEYTHHDSASVKEEEAQSILQSILYSIDLYLRNCPSFEQAMEALKRMPVAELHSRGLELMSRYVEKAKRLYHDVRNTRIPVSLVAYTETIDQGLSQFFPGYDIKFDAHNTVTSIDYPLLSDDMSWTGIIYIYRYLKHLRLENEICSRFQSRDIRALIESCGEKHGLDGTELLVNIAELTWKNAVAGVMIGKGADQLVLNEKDCERLYNRLQVLDAKELSALVEQAAAVILRELGLIELASHQYLLQFIKRLSSELRTAVRENSLTGFLTLSNNTSSDSTFNYVGGKKLADRELRLIIGRIRDCRDGEEKADLIEAEIHDLEDLVEVLDAYCIFDDEYAIVLRRMGDYELAVLSYELLDRSPLADDDTLSVQRWYRCESGTEWRNRLVDYLEEDAERYQRVVQLARGLARQRGQ